MDRVDKNTLRLDFGTGGYVNFCVSRVQNNYTQNNLLPITIEKDGTTINVFGAETLLSVFPVFKTEQTSYFKFEHNGKRSPCIQVSPNQSISSFMIQDVVYGLEILCKKKQDSFESSGGHSCKDLTVWLGVDKVVYNDYNTSTKDCACEIFGSQQAATVALNNTSSDKYITGYFLEPSDMNKRTFHFRFKNMFGNLYLN